MNNPQHRWYVCLPLFHRRRVNVETHHRTWTVGIRAAEFSSKIVKVFEL